MTPMETIKVYAPATVANVGCGFDVFGFALEAPGDVLRITRVPGNAIDIVNRVEGVALPLEPGANTAGIAVRKLLDTMGGDAGFKIDFVQKIPPGSGIGSSAASAAAAVFGVNELLGRPFGLSQLVEFAMEGEVAASGSPHADNVAPSLMGGFVLVRGYSPLDLVQIPVPGNLYCAVVHPQIHISTAEARAMLKKDLPLRDAVRQWGNVGGMVAGFFRNDYALIARSLTDVVAEPLRSALIPGFVKVKAAALDSGALGCSISGSGPSVFALCEGLSVARKVTAAMQGVFDGMNIRNTAYASSVDAGGTRTMN